MRRAWRGAFYAALLSGTWLLLAPADALPPEPAFPFADKLEHAALFAGLAVLARLAWPDKPAWGPFAALVLYGAAIEWAQREIPGRSAEALDLVADAVGALAAFIGRRR